MSCHSFSMYCGSFPISLPAHCSIVSFDPPSPMPVIPASVSTVITMLLWLNRGFRFGGAYARTRVIFIFGIAALTGLRETSETAATEPRNERRFIGHQLIKNRQELPRPCGAGYQPAAAHRAAFPFLT